MTSHEDGGKWVLLVEDDPDHALLTRRSIEALDERFRVVECAAVEEALAHLSAHVGEPPVATLVDIHLCGESGLDLVSKIRHRADGGRIRIAMLTSVCDETARSEALARSADAFVSKPLTTARARALLQDDVMRWEFADLPSDLSAYRELRRLCS